MAGKARYVVAGTKPWTRRVFDEVISRYPGVWWYIDRPEQLTLNRVKAFAPRYVFFLHWSWKVPTPLLRAVSCVAFHMTDVPFGRGGSPLQNLIARGHRRTKLSALQMTELFDAGPVYLKAPLALTGSANAIYLRMSRLAARMIRRLVSEEIVPAPQQGRPVLFKRRRPQQSRLPFSRDLDRLHDFIRMLDAEGYPRAFLERGGLRYEFTNAKRQNGRLIADVKITMGHGA